MTTMSPTTDETDVTTISSTDKPSQTTTLELIISDVNDYNLKTTTVFNDITEGNEEKAITENKSNRKEKL